MQQFLSPKQGTVDEELQKLENQHGYLRGLLQKITTFHATLQNYEPFFKTYLNQLEQIIPKLEPMMPMMNQQILPGQQQFMPNSGQYPPRPSPSFENFSQLDPSQIATQDVYDQCYSYLRNLVNQAPPCEDGKDYINELHKAFKNLLQTKDKLLSQRISPLPENVTSNDSQNSSPKILTYGEENLHFEKASDFSSLFKIPPNTITSKEQKLIDSDFPTKQSLSYIEENLEKENPIESLNTMYQDLGKSQCELLKELKDLESSSVPYQEYLQNPTFDIIRETPDYQRYKKGADFLMEEYKEKADDIQKRFNSLIQEHGKIVENLLELDFDPRDVKYNEMLKEHSEITDSQRKLLFINYIIEQLKLPQLMPDQSANFCKVDRDIMQQILDAASSGDAQRCEQLMRDYRAQLPDLKAKIEGDIKTIDQSKEKLDSQLMDVMKRRQKPIDKQAERDLQNAEERVDALKKRVSEAEQQIEQEFQQIREQYQQIKATDCSNFVAFPSNIEEILTKNAERLATKRWYKRRITALEQENAEEKKKLEQIRQQTEQMQDAIKQKRGQMDVMGRVKINKNLPRTLQEMKGLVNCPLCNQRRDTVILACGHTFCNDCAKNLIAKRNRLCPSCQTRFTQYDLKQFKYDNNK